MKLVRYGPPGKEKPGLIDADGKLLGIIAQADVARCQDIPKAQVGEVVSRVSEPKNRG